MTIVRELAQIRDVCLDQSRFARARRTMPYSSGPVKKSGKMVMRSKRIGPIITQRLSAVAIYEFISRRPSGRITSMREAAVSTRTQISSASGINNSPPGRANRESKGVPRTVSRQGIGRPSRGASLHNPPSFGRTAPWALLAMHLAADQIRYVIYVPEGSDMRSASGICTSRPTSFSACEMESDFSK